MDLLPPPALAEPGASFGQLISLEGVNSAYYRALKYHTRESIYVLHYWVGLEVLYNGIRSRNGTYIASKKGPAPSVGYAGLYSIFLSSIIRIRHILTLFSFILNNFMVSTTPDCA